MSNFQLKNSKIQNQKDSIFTTMSQLAHKYNATDLSQGFPNFETDDYLKELVTKAMKAGHNQYAPMAGVLKLRERIAEKMENLYGRNYNPETEVTVTNGATQALFSAITAFVQKGDEVIVFKPAYDSYEPSIKLNGGIPVLIQLKGAQFDIDWNELAKKITSKTRMIIINTPHNPSGTVLSKEAMLKLEGLLKNTDIILLSDEVYEHLVFDDNRHHSAAAFSGLAERAIICASFGKTFHNTGWKTGYCVAPSALMKEIRKVHQFAVFCVNHPMQIAYAEYLNAPEHYLQLGNFYQAKRDKFLHLMKSSKFSANASAGTYFQVMDYSEITNEGDVEFSERLIKEYKLASIPISVFNIDNKDNHQLRFCFAKTDETLEQAAEILSNIK
ncbi:MAG: methionine aminotransferase [Gillisia sp.]